MNEFRIGKALCHGVVITFFMLFSLACSAQNPLDDTKVSLKTGNKPLHLVLDELTEQTGYYFTFDSRLINSDEKKSISFKDYTLRAALDSLLGSRNFHYRAIRKNIVIYLPLPELNPISESNDTGTVGIITVSGHIASAQGHDLLPYATIGVVDSRLGTISNSDGDFTLHIPDTLANPILAVSYIGYKTRYYPVGIPSASPVNIFLEKQTISLQEVIIRHRDPLQLLTEAMKRTSQNYLDEPFGAIAYYRERVQRNDRILQFSEAVMDIARPSYRSAAGTDKIRILKGRKITSALPEDTVLFKISAGANTMLYLDIIRNLPDFLAPGFQEKYDLTFSDIVVLDDQLVYVIEFNPKPFIEATLFRGTVFIEQNDLAIVAADFEYDPAKIGNEPGMFVSKSSPHLKVRPVKASYHVAYKKTGSRYALSQVQGNVEFRVKKKRQWISSRYGIQLEMAITRVDPGNPPMISHAEKLKPSVILSDQEFEYDPGFWGNYNTIAPEMDLKEALSNIESSIREITNP